MSCISNSLSTPLTIKATKKSNENSNWRHVDILVMEKFHSQITGGICQHIIRYYPDLDSWSVGVICVNREREWGEHHDINPFNTNENSINRHSHKSVHNYIYTVE